MKTSIAAILSLAALMPQAHEKYVKELTFPEGTTAQQKIDMASRLVPDERQLAWQDRELTAFLHFGMNTFTGREWGDGKESPALFNPLSLDTDQWVRVLKDAGFKMVILTAKHHDGFCLWPTATTSHSVASSPWRDGAGDVVADLRRSCDKYGMKLGIYLSPWDRNADCYGDSPRYNDMFVAQLTELLTNYGKIDEVWFDGACGEGPNGKRQEYDWLRFRKVMKDLQPDAVLAITGDDVRWVGNEGGRGRETEWSVTPLVPSIYSYSDSVNNALGIDAISKDLGSRELVEKADRLYWWPSEVDVSIRPGWFYHDDQEPHTLAQLSDIYLQSVGRNSVLLLNIPPDRTGRINKKDETRLMELRRWIDTNFSTNLINCPDSAINAVILEEDITKGQRVERFEVLALTDSVWKPVSQGTTIGKKRILTFPEIKADSLKLNILSSRGTPHARLASAHHITRPGEVKKFKSAYPTLTSADWKHSVSTGRTPSYTIDMLSPQTVAGFIYTPPVSEKSTEGAMFRYRVEISTVGKRWREVPVNGEFGNIKANPIPQQIIFDQPVKARFIRITCTETTGPKLNPADNQITILAPKE